MQTPSGARFSLDRTETEKGRGAQPTPARATLIQRLGVH